MVGARFIVLKLREVIRIAVLALIGLIVIIVLTLMLLPKKNKTAELGKFIPGTYSATIILYDRPLEVLVSVSESEIERIALTEPNEAQEVFYPLFKPTMENLAGEIIRTQSTDLESDVTVMYTSQILLDAVNYALHKAAPREN